jgi:16S rRNA (guanine966-N2)-methyltransferase
LAPISGKDGRARGRRKTGSTAAQNKNAGLRNSVRIIGGEWRGRRIQFPPAAALRPTPDRVRETLFNWLQAHIGGARCLDLFAGSGALGLEALSRGARAAVFVEREPRVAAALRASLETLRDTRGRVIERDAGAFLAGPTQHFDVVFLDPPFAQGGLGELCTLLEARGWLAADAWIYLEFAAREARPPLPSGWTPWRETRAGEVQGLLAQRRAPGGAGVVDGT